MERKMETNYNGDGEILPASRPKYNVGRIIIESDQEEEKEEEWSLVNQYLVAPPPKSPNYTYSKETEDEQTNSEQALQQAAMTMKQRASIRKLSVGRDGSTSTSSTQRPPFREKPYKPMVWKTSKPRCKQ